MLYTVEVIKKEISTSGVIVVELSRPVDYIFEAGQYLNLYLKDDPAENNRDFKHTFSIAAAPFEKSLKIVSRLRESNFKASISDLKPGDKLYIGPAGGSFTVKINSPEVDLIFLAGGIGITPILSILKQFKHENVKNKVTLLWSNRTVESAPLFKEVKEVVNTLLNAGAYYFFTATNASEKSINGRIDLDFFVKSNLNKDMVMYYIVGSEAFVTDMHSLLNAYGVAFDQIVSDSFGGY